MSGALGVKRCVIKEGTHFGVAALASKNIQLLFRANEIT